MVSPPLVSQSGRSTSESRGIETANADFRSAERCTRIVVSEQLHPAWPSILSPAPDRLYRFADALTRSITTNPEIAHVKELVDLAEQFKNIDLRHIRFVTLPNQIYNAPYGQPLYGRVQILPAAYRLMRIVDRDEPLGAFRRGSTDAGHSHKPPSAAATAQAEAAGVCA
jgi:hypothetical protein